MASIGALRDVLAAAAALVASSACGAASSGSDPFLGSGTADGGESGDDGPCSLQADGSLALLDGQSVPGIATALAWVGDEVLACGEGFVALVGGASVELTGTCTGLAALDDRTAFAVTREGDLLRVSLASGLAVDDETNLGVAAFGVATDGEATVAIASGADGVRLADAQTLDSTTLTTAVHARAVAFSGTDWLVGGDGHVTRIDASGSEGDAIALAGTVARIVVDGARAIIVRAAFGFDVVDLEDGLTSIATVPTEGTAVDAAIAGNRALVATGAALHRYELGDGEPELSARAPRPDATVLDGAWVRAVAAGDDEAFVAIGNEVVRAEIGEATEGAVAATPRATSSLWGEGEVEIVLLVRNDGNADLAIDEPTIDGALALGELQGAQPRAGCDGQHVVAPGGTLLATLRGDVGPEPQLVDVAVRTNDPHHDALPLPVEINRPSPSIGDAAPDVSLLTFHGDLVQSSALRGEILYLKLFSYS